MIFQRASHSAAPDRVWPAPPESRPRYVNRWGVLGAPQPFGCERLEGHFFVLKARFDRLQFLCDRYLNLPGQNVYQYSPVSDLILLYFNRAEKVFCESPIMQQLGWGTETNVAFVVPTVARRVDPRASGDDHFALFFPYMWVDNPVALTLGREIYGFPKELGWMALPNHSAPSGNGAASAERAFRLDAFALTRFDEQSRMARRLLLEVVSPGGVGAVGRGDESWLATVRRLLFSEAVVPPIPGLDLLQTTIVQAFRRELTLVCLMQFYDPADGERACYQAIVEAPANVTNVREAPSTLPGPWRLRLQSLASHPIEAELGLSNNSEVEGAFKAKLDVTIQRGKTIWRAADGAAGADASNGRASVPVRDLRKE
jgi:hypothetical protein